MQKRPLARALLGLGLVAGALCFPALAQTGGRHLPELGDVTEQHWSQQAEREAARSIIRHLRLRDPAYLDDPKLTEYLQTLGNTLATHSDRPHTPLVFFALRDPSLNAFALPGGYIGINTGLILTVQSEAELASVLAHEIAHVTQRHIAQHVGQNTRSSFLVLASVLMGALAARHNPDIAQAAVMGAQAGAIESQLSYSRDFEREADRIGLQMLKESGIDPRGMVLLFERMQRQQRLLEGGGAGYWRSHPLTTERIAEAMQRIEALPYRQVPDSIDFELARARARVLQQGGVEALRFFESLPNQALPGVRYGLALSAFEANQTSRADDILSALPANLRQHPWIATLHAQIQARQGKLTEALAQVEAADRRSPGHLPLILERLERHLALGQADKARDLATAHTRSQPEEPAFWRALAQAHAALGERLGQHEAQAEFYVRMGALSEAISQLEQALRLPDLDFRAQSVLDARLQTLRAQWADEEKSRFP
jgi:beta-barrel assembly-enhancing protease